MSNTSPLLLIGVGGAGCAIAHGVCRAFGEPMRHLLCDTDAQSAKEGSDFILIGGDRLLGRGAGGDVAQARLATEESLHSFAAHLDGVRLAIVVTSLGCGTGGGATLEILKYLENSGIANIVFATTPFTFEGEEKIKRAQGIVNLIEETGVAAIISPLDKLIAQHDNMDEAMRHAVGTIASGVSLFWRMLQKPGYISLDSERLRKAIAMAKRGRFATVTVQGAERAREAVELLKNNELLATGAAARSILLGILAGEDLRLSEVGSIAEGVREAFGANATFNVATVNDESTFSGRISVVLLIFDSVIQSSATGGATGGRRRKRDTGVLSQGPKGRGRFHNTEPTIYNGEDLDVPTFVRKNITLDV